MSFFIAYLSRFSGILQVAAVSRPGQKHVLFFPQKSTEHGDSSEKNFTAKSKKSKKEGAEEMFS
jgi:hypothetical protein